MVSPCVRAGAVDIKEEGRFPQQDLIRTLVQEGVVLREKTSDTETGLVRFSLKR